MFDKKGIEKNTDAAEKQGCSVNGLTLAYVTDSAPADFTSAFDMTNKNLQSNKVAEYHFQLASTEAAASITGGNKSDCKCKVNTVEEENEQEEVGKEH